MTTTRDPQTGRFVRSPFHILAGELRPATDVLIADGIPSRVVELDCPDHNIHDDDAHEVCSICGWSAPNPLDVPLFGPRPAGPIARRLETLALRIDAGTITPEMAAWHLAHLAHLLRVAGSPSPAATDEAIRATFDPDVM